MATHGALMVVVEAWFRFRVRPANLVTLTAQSFLNLSVFQRSLARNGVPGDRRRSTFTGAPYSFFDPCPFYVAGVGHAGHFEVWFVAGAMLGDVFKSSGVSFCEPVVIFDLGHDDDSVWQVLHFECLELIFRGKRNTSKTSTKRWLKPRYKIVLAIVKVI